MLPPHHTLRDTHLLFLIKEIALLCWLFYLKPWLPLCPPDHAVAETRRRAEGLIGAWDARGGAAGLGGRRGEPLMGLPVCGSPLSPLSASDATWSAFYSSDCHQITCKKTTVWFVSEPFLQMGNRFSFKISITEWMTIRGNAIGLNMRSSSPAAACYSLCVCEGSYPCLLLLVLFNLFCKKAHMSNGFNAVWLLKKRGEGGHGILDLWNCSTKLHLFLVRFH